MVSQLRRPGVYGRGVPYDIPAPTGPSQPGTGTPAYLMEANVVDLYGKDFLPIAQESQVLGLYSVASNSVDFYYVVARGALPTITKTVNINTGGTEVTEVEVSASVLELGQFRYATSTSTAQITLVKPVSTHGYQSGGSSGAFYVTLATPQYWDGYDTSTVTPFSPASAFLALSQDTVSFAVSTANAAMIFGGFKYTLRPVGSTTSPISGGQAQNIPNWGWVNPWSGAVEQVLPQDVLNQYPWAIHNLVNFAGIFNKDALPA